MKKPQQPWVVSCHTLFRQYKIKQTGRWRFHAPASLSWVLQFYTQSDTFFVFCLCQTFAQASSQTFLFWRHNASNLANEFIQWILIPISIYPPRGKFRGMDCADQSHRYSPNLARSRSWWRHLRMSTYIRQFCRTIAYFGHDCIGSSKYSLDDRARAIWSICTSRTSVIRSRFHLRTANTSDWHGI